MRRFVCKSCSHEAVHAPARCSRCKAWSSYAPIWGDAEDEDLGPQKLEQIEGESICRVETGLEWFDGLVGGGLVQGGVYLFAGDPGAGKSTLVLQLIKEFLTPLYLSGEETSSAIKDRYLRLWSKEPGKSGRHHYHPGLYVYRTTSMDRGVDTPLLPDIVIADSLHTFSSDDVSSPPGTNTQILAVCSAFVGYVKELDAVGILIAHVNKDDAVSGPNAAKHLVDASLYLASNPKTGVRTLTVDKNRYGPAPTSQTLAMTMRGLVVHEDKDDATKKD